MSVDFEFVLHDVDRPIAHFFTLSEAAGDEHLPALLRAAADRLDAMGEVIVRDVVVAPAQHARGASTVTVYYERGIG